MMLNPFFACLLLLLLNGCATLQSPPDAHDPWERFNRSMFKFNNTVDKAVIKPVAKGYRKVTPDLVEKGVSNFFANLGEIRIIANDLFQLKFRKFFSDTGRFLVNSTIGLYGLFDVATPIGLKKHNEDFGQSLGRWGVGSGPYLVLPFFGSSSVRDGIGTIVDAPLNPVREVEDTEARYALYALDLISLRAELLEAGDILQEAAYDPYIFLREAYLQRRNNLVHDGNPPAEDIDEEIDIFSED